MADMSDRGGSPVQPGSPYMATSGSGRAGSARGPGSYAGSNYSGEGTTILLEKRARRAAEEDALRLYNRVRQLQKEELKAKKRIDETRKRAEEIKSYRQRNEIKQQEKIERLESQLEEVERQRIQNLQLKDESVKIKQKNEEQILSEKMLVAARVKDEREEIERQLAEERLIQRRMALQKKEEVKKSEVEKKKKLQKLQEEKMKKTSEEYEKRLLEEQKERMKKQKELHKMAKMEAELIERLKRKQIEQAEAYSVLEMALGMPTGKGSTTIHAEEGANGEPSEEEIAQTFSNYDEDGSGMMSCESLGELMASLGVPLNPHQLSQAVAQLDVDSTGQISFGEFLLWWRG